MRARGEFRFENGLIVPNNVTLYGHDLILQLAFQHDSTTFWVALADAAPDQELQIEDLTEPTIGVNGYARQQLSQNATDWPTLGTLNGEKYIESKSVVFAPVGGDFDQASRRLAILDSQTNLTGDVIALSASFPTAITIGLGTVLADRTFKYRFYLR